MMPFPSPQVVLPNPTMLCTRRRSQACDTILGPQHCHPARACDVVEPLTPSNPQCPQAHNAVILPKPARLQYCIFFFVILGLQILILICYIAFNMSHCFDMLHCFWYAALLSYATLPHCFDMLHCFCSTAFLLYVATLLWYATHCYIAFVLLHSDLYECILHCSMRNWAKWDECGNMGQHYCAIKISASNNMKQIGHSIKLKSNSI
jgi:hypothetical protein